MYVLVSTHTTAGVSVESEADGNNQRLDAARVPGTTERPRVVDVPWLSRTQKALRSAGSRLSLIAPQPVVQADRETKVADSLHVRRWPIVESPGERTPVEG